MHSQRLTIKVSGQPKVDKCHFKFVQDSSIEIINVEWKRDLYGRWGYGEINIQYEMKRILNLIFIDIYILYFISFSYVITYLWITW